MSHIYSLPRFVSERIDQHHPLGCWMWGGRVDRDGFGRVDMPGAPGSLVHRVVYEAEVGPIGEGLVLCHQCDERHGRGIAYRRCCNPAHLLPGTRAENNAERSQRGRSARQRPKAPGAPPGRRYW